MQRDRVEQEVLEEQRMVEPVVQEQGLVAEAAAAQQEQAQEAPAAVLAGHWQAVEEEEAQEISSLRRLEV